MNSFSIAVRLFKTNIRTYFFYLAVLIFSVAVYYEFMALKYNPEVLKVSEAVAIAYSAAIVTSFVLLMFLIFFIWYSSSFFLKQRKKEIGVYLLMGISSARIGLVFAIESLFLGITATAGGLLAGILVSKLFFMALARVALLNVTIDFFIPVKGIYELLMTFGAIFAALSVRNYVSVVRSRLIDLINDSKKEEGEPRLKAVRGILSILLIGAGYFISQKFFSALTMIPIVALVVMGTYWFFGSFMPAVMISLLRNKKILYKGSRIVSINNLAWRLRSNYRSLAVLAVIAATTITSFGTSLSLKYYTDNTKNILYPYSFSYVSDDGTLNQEVEDAVNASPHPLLMKEQLHFLKIEGVKHHGANLAPFNLLAVSWSEYGRLSGNLSAVSGKEQPLPDPPGGDDAYYIPAPVTIASLSTGTDRQLSYSGGSINIAGYLKAPLFGVGANGTMPCIVVSDAKYDELKSSCKENIFNGLIVSDAENSGALGEGLNGMLPKSAGFTAYVNGFRASYSFMGLFFFLGVFMSVVFIFATGSIMYFKLLGEGLADRHKYETLDRIGMSREEIRSAISSQVGMSLITPLLLGILHSLFAISVLKGMLNYDLTVPTLAAIMVFAVFYGAFYMMTTRKFMGLVTAGPN